MMLLNPITTQRSQLSAPFLEQSTCLLPAAASHRSPQPPTSRKNRACRTMRVSVSGNGSTEQPTGVVPADIGTLQRAKVQRAGDGQTVALTSLWQGNQRVVLAFFTHFGDLSSFEFAQKLLPRITQLEAAGIGVGCVGLGEPEKARKFAEMLNFPVDILYADANGTTYRDLGFNPGFLPETDINPYAKLLPMLMGIGSQGTIQEVFRGYVGDRQSPAVFSGSNPFDVLGQGYQRPFELATLRLYNMNAVLSNWGALAPEDGALLTLQGGCMVIEGSRVLYKHSDSGILKYADVNKVVDAALDGLKDAPPSPIETQVARPFM